MNRAMRSHQRLLMGGGRFEGMANQSVVPDIHVATIRARGAVLFRPNALWGWLAFVWWIVERLETVGFIHDGMPAVTALIRGYGSDVAMLAGFAWLTWLLVRPPAKQPKEDPFVAVEQRLTDTEARLPIVELRAREVRSDLDSLSNVLRAEFENMRGRISVLERALKNPASEGSINEESAALLPVDEHAPNGYRAHTCSRCGFGTPVPRHQAGSIYASRGASVTCRNRECQHTEEVSESWLQRLQ